MGNLESVGKYITMERAVDGHDEEASLIQASLSTLIRIRSNSHCLLGNTISSFVSPSCVMELKSASDEVMAV